ncbi:hypothetical protein EST38_g2534 [Candolleomyces aberdarensis]|uniref:Uncharacterized protein n=1 Tax=Candolleomyces aberdarensis TaxID=2316362 RepID=A0A4Q2DVA1_9AGAR|nr:hypothetical protein EST38_g2534 [Candolleomyces aberdarensis]
MKQLAARDFEDLLQCAIPVFEGLFENRWHEKRILRLLFTLAHWHGLAKLRLHTDTTLDILDHLTTVLGDQFRGFVSKVCEQVETKELPKEYHARKRREAKQKGKKKSQRTIGKKGAKAQRGGGDIVPQVEVPELQPSDMASSSTSTVPQTTGKRGTKRQRAASNIPPVFQVGSSSSHGAKRQKVAQDTAGTDVDAVQSQLEGMYLNEKTATKGKRAMKRQNGAPGTDITQSGPNEAAGRQAKVFTLRTFKFHALGHVVRNIKRFGTTDNYSTQLPETYHRFVKNMYKRTSKKKVPLTMSRILMRQARIKRIKKLCRQLLPSKDEGPPDALRQAPYFIGKSEKKPVHLGPFLREHHGDPATVKFLAKLKQHLLPRIRQALLEEARADLANYDFAISTLERLVRGESEDESHRINEEDRIFIASDRLYRHEILHINYTTYDLRREQDILNPNTTRRDFMSLAEESENEENSHGTRRFCYGRLLGIYHVNIVFHGEGSFDRKARRFDFLHVRWYSQPDVDATWSSQQLDCIEFPSIVKPDSVDFLDPSLVLRGCHVIPRFSAGRAFSPKGSNSEKELQVSTIAKNAEDWEQYFVNRFVDRDMIMRYHWGLGVGHLYSHEDAPNVGNMVNDVAPDADEHGLDAEGEDNIDSTIPLEEAPEGQPAAPGRGEEGSDTDESDGAASEYGLEDRQGDDAMDNELYEEREEIEDGRDIPEADSDGEA